MASEALHSARCRHSGSELELRASLSVGLVGSMSTEPFQLPSLAPGQQHSCQATTGLFAQPHCHHQCWLCGGALRYPSSTASQHQGGQAAVAGVNSRASPQKTSASRQELLSGDVLSRRKRGGLSKIVGGRDPINEPLFTPRKQGYCVLSEVFGQLRFSF